MKKILLVIFLVVSGCASFEKTPKHIEIACRIMGQHTKIEKKRNKMHPFGSGGSFIKGIREIFLCYEKYESVDLNRARELIVNTTELLICLANNDLEAKQFFIDGAFTCNNAGTGIIFSDKQGFIKAPYIASVFILEGTIYYRLSPDGKDLVKYYSEDYEDARKIVLGESIGENCPKAMPTCY